jgi:hypothetical protein
LKAALIFLVVNDLCIVVEVVVDEAKGRLLAIEGDIDVVPWEVVWIVVVVILISSFAIFFPWK